MALKSIIVRGARQHNLKNINVEIPRNTLAVITVQAGVGRRLAAKRPEEASAALESIETIGRTAQDELRVVLGLLREEEAGAAPLAPAPRLADVEALVAAVRASGTPVELQMSGADRQLSPALELSVYRVIQEALTNVIKHAAASSAHVTISYRPDSVTVEITDQGSPGPPGRAGSGHGIIGMRERAASVGGSLQTGPAPGGGYRVFAALPAGGTVPDPPDDAQAARASSAQAS